MFWGVLVSQSLAALAFGAAFAQVLLSPQKRHHQSKIMISFIIIRVCHDHGMLSARIADSERVLMVGVSDSRSARSAGTRSRSATAAGTSALMVCLYLIAYCA